MQFFTFLSQDEFKQWFRAKVHVMLAPGKMPFDDLDLQSKNQLPNGDGDHSAQEEEEDHVKSLHRPPAQVLRWEAMSALSGFILLDIIIVVVFMLYRYVLVFRSSTIWVLKRGYKI